MAKNDPASVVAGAGLLTGIFTKLNAAVLERGGRPEDLHRLTTPEGDDVISEMAKLVVFYPPSPDKIIDYLEFNLSGDNPTEARAYNALCGVGITTIEALVSHTAEELTYIPNFGDKSLDAVRERLAAHGLALKGEEATKQPEGAPPSLPTDKVVAELFRMTRLVNLRLGLHVEIQSHEAAIKEISEKLQDGDRSLNRTSLQAERLELQNDLETLVAQYDATVKMIDRLDEEFMLNATQ